MTAKTPRRLRNVLVALLVLAALYAAYRITLRCLIEVKLNAIRKQGYPATLEEVEKFSGRTALIATATKQYLLASAQMKEPSEELKKRLPIIGYLCTPSRTELLPEDMKVAMASYLRDNSSALSSLTEAATNSDIPVPRDPISGKSMMPAQTVPFLSPARQGGRLLAVQALFTAANGDAEAASRAVISSAGLGNVLSDRPFLISYFADVALLQMAAASLEQVLNRTALTDWQLTEIDSAFQKIDVAQRFKVVLAGERAYGNLVWRELGNGTESAVGLGSVYGLENFNRMQQAALCAYRPVGVVDLDYLARLDLFGRLIEAGDQPEPERIPHARSIARQFGLRWYRPLTSMEANLLVDSFTHAAKSTAKLRAVHAALAILRGENPEALETLDPFTGQPLRYKKLAKGYVVYSVGEDGKDDGGDEKKDITFTVER